ncbi:MAG: M48 family metalloprotease, partial [Chlamydiota bacterium]
MSTISLATAPPSSQIRERFLDFKYAFWVILKESATKPFLRPWEIYCQLKSFANPDRAALADSDRSVSRITRESIASGKLFPCHSDYAKLVPSTDQLLYALDRVETLAQKMGIKQEVHLYAGLFSEEGSFGASLFGKPSIIKIGPSLLNSKTNPEIDFVLAHELAHIKHHDNVRSVAFMAAAMLVQTVFFFAISPLALLVLEPVINLSQNYLLSRSQESRADRTSIQTLQTNAGAIRYLSEEIGFWRFFKTSTHADILKVTMP